ncbi:hypothetical protein BASA83_009397 [Batrachochytrium salamandrivorans]|nr:hypothetical protein BASA83_009397 [Batrachochytrium salamandrivorans]
MLSKVRKAHIQIQEKVVCGENKHDQVVGVNTTSTARKSPDSEPSLSQEPLDHTIQGKYNQCILAEATASRLTKQDDHLRWRSHCTHIDNLLAGGCAKQAWNAAKRMACASGHSCRFSNPIRNEEGVLQFQPIFICNTLRSHYMQLAEAGEGHSLDPTHWETMPQPPQHIPSSSTLSMDLPFSLRELDHALGSMHPRKAPGDDGITTALMQAIAHDPKDHGTGDVNLDRPGALALLRVANTISYLVSSQKCGGVPQ